MFINLVALSGCLISEGKNVSSSKIFPIKTIFKFSSTLKTSYNHTGRA